MSKHIFSIRIGVTILRKGQSDHISAGETGTSFTLQRGLNIDYGTDPYSVKEFYAVHAVSVYGSPRRCGGQGDILSGR